MTIFVYYASMSSCEGCALRSKCTTSLQTRRVWRWENGDVLDAMQARLERAPEKMQLRRQTVEHAFGTIKGLDGLHALPHQDPA